MTYDGVIRFTGRFLGLCLTPLILISCDNFSLGGENIPPSSSYPVIYVKRSVQALAEPIDPVRFVAGGDLFWRDAASASAEEINLTRSYTNGAGDVSSPEVSYDGSKVVFAMRRPADASWNIWVLDVASKQLTQLLADDAFDDLHPHFLVDGRIVFSSDRQTASRQQLANDNIEAFSYLDSKGRHRASLLHVMEADGSNIRQISFHVGHDRDATVLNNGKLIFNRWEATGQRSHFPIISMNPDGTSIQTLYGAYSKGNSFLSPRQLANGKLIAIHAPAAGTHGGGALVEIDISNYGDLQDRVQFIAAGAVAQKQLSLNTINSEVGLSRYGRFLSPYPVEDGSNRILVSWSASNPQQMIDSQTGLEREVEGSPGYGVYLMDLDNKNMKPVVTSAPGVVAYDAIVIQPRTVPVQIDDQFAGVGGNLVQNLVTTNEGILHVRSVYDTDVNDLLGPSMMIATETLPQIASTLDDPRPLVADIVTLKNPALTTPENRPARFVRITKAVAIPEGTPQTIKGSAGNVMQQILGYSEVEPDGSVLVKVPADTPVSINVLDANGRAITSHNSWIQVRPGEVLECAGCHSPRKRSAINVFPIAGNNPVVQITPAQLNDTMAETRARILNGDVNNPNALNQHLVYTDLWVTDTILASAVAGSPVTRGVDINIDYAGLASPPSNGIVNFVDHVQPILNARCVSCHGAAAPDLSLVAGPDGVLQSYKNLVQGTVDLDFNGNPQLNFKDLAWLTQKQLPYVLSGTPRNTSRTSYLMEKLSGTELRAARALSGGTNHNVLTAAELRVITEWLDTGAMYYNTPFIDSDVSNSFELSEIINLQSTPDYTEFTARVKPVLDARCASCHRAINNKSDFDQNIVTSTLSNPVPSETRSSAFVLTGDALGDYRAAVAQLENRALPVNNKLLSYPLSDGSVLVHPQLSDGAGGFVPVLSNAEADYSTISDWILP